MFVGHARCWIFTEGNVRHQRDDRCLESLEFRDSRHGVLKRKRQEKGKEKQAKKGCVKFLVMVNFWSCQNSGRVEILVVVALRVGRWFRRAKMETMARREIRVLVGKCRRKKFLHYADLNSEWITQKKVGSY